MGKKLSGQTVKVDIEDDFVTVSVNIVVEFGCDIPKVSGGVQEMIKEKIKQMTGKSVAKVNVIVSDLAEPEPDPPLTEPIIEEESEES